MTNYEEIPEDAEPSLESAVDPDTLPRDGNSDGFYVRDEADEKWNDDHRPPEYDGPLDLTPPIPDPEFVVVDESEEEGRLPLPD